MERVVKEETTGKPKWRKIGGGSLRIGNRIIKPGQTFEANSEEISPAFRNMVIPVSGDAVFKSVVKEFPKEDVPVKDVIKTEFEMVPHGKSLFLFDVVNKETGKPVNEKSLKKDVAETLLADLLK
jgi:hypothetical protein